MAVGRKDLKGRGRGMGTGKGRGKGTKPRLTGKVQRLIAGIAAGAVNANTIRIYAAGDEELYHAFITHPTVRKALAYSRIPKAPTRSRSNKPTPITKEEIDAALAYIGKLKKQKAMEGQTDHELVKDWLINNEGIGDAHMVDTVLMTMNPARIEEKARSLRFNSLLPEQKSELLTDAIIAGKMQKRARKCAR